jgi:hypothetical protein
VLVLYDRAVPAVILSLKLCPGAAVNQKYLAASDPAVGEGLVLDKLHSPPGLDPSLNSIPFQIQSLEVSAGAAAAQVLIDEYDRCVVADPVPGVEVVENGSPTTVNVVPVTAVIT